MQRYDCPMCKSSQDFIFIERIQGFPNAKPPIPTRDKLECAQCGLPRYNVVESTQGQ